ncbi:MAG TPA: tetratricopeptide repeat protein [Terriglobales bacterium]|jgi:tetratricopeptide (TPR) repeat protein|nr:tetratricopeptide repeat protein [Terriglobales bacterium]
MSKVLYLILVSLTFCGVWPVLSHGQSPKKVVEPGAASSAQQGISLAEKGDCSEALPVLKRVTAHIAETQLKYHAAMALARCAMSLDQTEVAVNAVLLLNREFPRDPEVLYVTTHYYSELASRASQQLVATSPSSCQVRELDAEALESQGKWDEATAEYRKIVEQNPNLPQIHYRLGRILLAKPGTPTTAEDAAKEFQEELKIDPDNASAEFMLGELARQAGNWDVAIQHFSRATKLDIGFSEAYLALGMSLSSAGNFAGAITPLEKYVNMEASDAAGHYQLAIAYSRTGDKQKAQREMALQAEAERRNPQATPDSVPAH